MNKRQAKKKLKKKYSRNIALIARDKEVKYSTFGRIMQVLRNPYTNYIYNDCSDDEVIEKCRESIINIGKEYGFDIEATVDKENHSIRLVFDDKSKFEDTIFIHQNKAGLQ